MPRPFLIRLGALALLTACSSDSSTSDPGDGCPNGIGTPSGATITYEVVTVGDADNPADKTGFGTVDHVYGIGKYNVSIGQYAAFLNAVADTDTHGLYHESMGTDLNIAGIARSGGPGSHVYSVVNNGGDSSNRPIAYVTWFAAARFANWMANGQPEGPQGPATTEDGAYALLGATSGPAVAKNACNPNTGASVTHWLPTENEWYKAAYYDPTLNGGLGGYHLYATRSSSAPGNVVGSTPNQMNVIVGVNFAVTQDPTLFAGQNYLTDGGAFTASPSHYGTFDQNGNLYQWNDLDGTPYPYRGVRGSFWFAGAQAAQSIIFAGQTPTHAGNDVGFRLASIAR